MRILVVEDERKTSAYLQKGLSESGFVVDTAYRGDDGLHLALTHDYDLVILDVTLPELDGWSVLAAIRKGSRQTPVLFLTARDAVEDRVKGLELGADDYLVKPFAFSELLARVRSILRRGPSRQPETLRLADLELDLIRRGRRGRPAAGPHGERICPLVPAGATQGEVLSRTLIAEQVWDMNFDSDTNVVDVAVRRLRAKIDDPFPSRLVHTVRGFGYVMEERPQ
jgi:two-component system copper resistance phosphate regulon response regulator CusR